RAPLVSASRCRGMPLLPSLPPSAPAPPEPYPLSLHDALPICGAGLGFVSTYRVPTVLDAAASFAVRAAALRLSFPISFRRLEYRSEEHTSELQSRENLVCRLLLEKKNCQIPVRPPARRYNTPA